MGVVQQVQQFLGRSGETDETAEMPREPTHLFRCEACRETYISVGMDRCPACEDDVERIPSERDLGFV